jgi:hypothetical protein
MSDFHVQSNVDQILQYEWKGKPKRCDWSLNATGQFQIDRMGQGSAESAEIDRFLQTEQERGNIGAD